MSIHALRKKFIKDYGLPIQVVRSPYFEYYLELFNPLYGTVAKYEAFVKEVNDAGDVEKFLQKYNGTKEIILDHVVNKQSYQKFNNDLLDEYKVGKGIEKMQVYHPENHGKIFVSVDLKKANFHALKNYDADIVDGKDTYEEWISQFVDSEHIQKSKFIRQVIFGNLNPKKQVKIEKYIIQDFVNIVLQYRDIKQIKAASHDEIVFEYGPDFENLSSELVKLSQANGFPIHIEIFKLIKQEPVKALGYVKEDLNGNIIDYKCVPALFAAQAYKYYNGIPITKEDLVFYHEGHIAYFDKPVRDSVSDDVE